MKRKEWEIRVMDHPNETVSGENDEFYTTDTEAFLVFKLVDENFGPTAATLTLDHRGNGMSDSIKVPVTNGLIVWEMTKKYIGHSGNWSVQIVYEFMKDSILEKYTSAQMIFDVKPHLADKKKPSVTQVDNWRTFMEESSSVIDRVQERINTGEFDGTITFEELTPGQIEMLRGHEGKGLEYIWDGTQLGIRVEGETDYDYVDLKGDKGDPATWASLEGKPTTFKPEAHTHKISEVSGLSAELGNTAVIQDLKNEVANLKSQKGSNQHGHWIKRPDGVMTTWTTFQVSGEPDKWGELYYWQPNPVDITFPQPFIESPTVQYTNHGSHFLWTQSTTRHQAQNISGYRGVDTSIQPVTVTLKATGRWSEAVDGNFFKGRDLPSYWRSHLTNKINTIKQHHNKHKDNFSFIFITDLHMDLNVGKSFALVQILLEATDAEIAVVGGDLVENPAITPKPQVLRQIKEVVDGLTPYWERVMMVVGNHDDNTNSRSLEGTLTVSEQYDSMMKQMGGSVVYGGNKTYYYKDDTLNKVRYIGLNSVDIPYIKEGIGLKYLSGSTHAYRQTQINWLANTALRTPGDDWTVVVTSHTPPYKGNMKAYDFPTHNEELARGLVKAYKDKGSYSGSSKSGTPSDFTASVSADYSNGGGDVAVWLSGHVHYDNVVMTPEGIPLITTLNDGSRRWLDAPIRTAGTIREQALDVITVNRNERKLYLTRVGAGADRVVSY